VHPPGKTGDFIGLLKVCVTLVVAHKQAADSIFREGAVRGTTPIVMMASNLIWFQAKLPWWKAPISTALALLLSHAYNYVLSDVCVYGKLPSWPIPMDTIGLFCGLRPLARSMKGSVNAIGINHYFRHFTEVYRSTGFEMSATNSLVISLPMGITLRAGADADGRFEQSDMGWDLTPSSLGRIVRVASRRYPGVPIYITESGSAAEDTTRTRYLVGCLRAIQDAIKAGADVRTYTYWTLMDNFEWAEGFGKRFGLAETNFETLKLTPRPTATLYSEIIRDHQSTAAKSRPVESPNEASHHNGSLNAPSDEALCSDPTVETSQVKSSPV